MQESVAERLAQEHGIRPQRGGAFRQGDNTTLCPNCSSKRKKANQRKPCLSVKLDSNGGAVWNCHHCFFSGNIPGRRPGDNGYRPEPERKIAPGKQLPPKPSRPQALVKYFEGRSISEETLEFFNVHVRAGIYFPQIEGKAPAIVYPYLERGVVTNNKYRTTTGKHFRQDKDAKKTLYNADSLIDAEECIWVEGENDVLATHDAGYQGIGLVSLPDGAPPARKDDVPPEKEEIDPTEHRYVAISNCAELLTPIQKHYIATDDDVPGNRLAYQIAMRVGLSKAYRVSFPEGCKDLNEVKQAHGAEGVQRCIEEANPFPIAGLYTLKIGDLVSWRHEPAQKMFSIGIPELDGLLKVRRGDLCVVTGVPTMGKSEFVDFMMVELTKAYGWRWAVFSPEHKHLDHAGKVAEKFMREPFKDYGGAVRAMSDEKLRQAEYWIKANYSWIVREQLNDLVDIHYILDRARAAHLVKPIQGLVIDPFNRINHRGANTSDPDYVAWYLDLLKMFAIDLNILVIQIAHPQKLSRNRQGDRPVPTLYDISGPAHWFNMPDLGAVIHRPEMGSSDVDVHIAKCKQKDQGEAGIAELAWNKFTGCYLSRSEMLL